MITGTKTVTSVSILYLRVQISIHERYRSEPILLRLVADHKLTVNVSNRVLKTDGKPRQLDLELTGTIAQTHKFGVFGIFESQNSW